MATAYVTIGPVWTRDVFLGIGNRSETIATSAASARGNLVAEAGQFAQIVCQDGVYATTAPTATTSNGIYCAPGVPTYIALQGGDRVALIDA